MKTSRMLLVFASLLVAGCVGMDTWGVHEKGNLPVHGLSAEQMQQLKSAASMGEPSLIATAGRMTWENPDQAQSLANYAANLVPERAEEIRTAVVSGLAR